MLKTLPGRIFRRFVEHQTPIWLGGRTQVPRPQLERLPACPTGLSASLSAIALAEAEALAKADTARTLTQAPRFIIFFLKSGEYRRI